MPEQRPSDGDNPLAAIADILHAITGLIPDRPIAGRKPVKVGEPTLTPGGQAIHGGLQSYEPTTYREAARSLVPTTGLEAAFEMLGPVAGKAAAILPAVVRRGRTIPLPELPTGVMRGVQEAGGTPTDYADTLAEILRHRQDLPYTEELEALVGREAVEQADLPYRPRPLGERTAAAPRYRMEQGTPIEPPAIRPTEPEPAWMAEPQPQHRHWTSIREMVREAERRAAENVARRQATAPRPAMDRLERGVPVPISDFTEPSVLRQMAAEGLVEETPEGWVITAAGRQRPSGGVQSRLAANLEAAELADPELARIMRGEPMPPRPEPAYERTAAAAPQSRQTQAQQLGRLDDQIRQYGRIMGDTNNPTVAIGRLIDIEADPIQRWRIYNRTAARMHNPDFRARSHLLLAGHDALDESTGGTAFFEPIASMVGVPTPSATDSAGRLALMNRVYEEGLNNWRQPGHWIDRVRRETGMSASRLQDIFRGGYAGHSQGPYTRESAVLDALEAAVEAERRGGRFTPYTGQPRPTEQAIESRAAEAIGVGPEPEPPYDFEEPE
jgi:hypothetical protein